MRKKKLVKKILAPIFKSSSQEEEINNPVSSPAGEVSPSSEVGNGYLPDLSPRLVDIDASLFAREITLIDKELFIRIPWPELANCGWMTKDKVRNFLIVQCSIECRRLVVRLPWFFVTVLCDWLAKQGLLSQPMRCKTEINRASLARVFLLLAPATVYICCDWPE